MTRRALLSTWTWDPTVIVGIAIAAWWYARGLGRLWGRAGVGRGVSRDQALAFAGGLAVLVVALISPLDALDTTLFSAHMAQHLLLMLVAAPLLVCGASLAPFLWALPLGWRRALSHAWQRSRVMHGAWRGMTHPMVVWLLNLAVLWAWHIPILYEAALRNDAIHAGEHLSLLGASLLFWWLLRPAGHRRLARGIDVLYVFTIGLQMSVLGALITFAGAPWYPVQEAQVAVWQLTPLEDQQLAGLIMWIPSGVVYLLAIAFLFVAWLRAEETAMRRLETRFATGTVGRERAVNGE